MRTMKCRVPQKSYLVYAESNDKHVTSPEYKGIEVYYSKPMLATGQLTYHIVRQGWDEKRGFYRKVIGSNNKNEIEFNVGRRLFDEKGKPIMSLKNCVQYEKKGIDDASIGRVLYKARTMKGAGGLYSLEAVR